MLTKNRIGLVLFYLMHILYVLVSYYINEGQTQFGLYIIFHVIFLGFWVFFRKINFSFFHIIIMSTFYLGSPPLFENDHFRYIWEGKVIAAGENPYKLAPNDTKLDHVKYEMRDKIAYNKLTSIYPPIAQTFFASVSFFGHKTAFFILQMLGLTLCIGFLYTQFKSRHDYLILLSPYFFKEFIQAVHIDILAVFILLMLTKLNYKYLGIVLSFFTKILSLLILPFLLIEDLYKQNKKSLLYGLVSVVSIVLLTVLYPTNLKFASGAEAFIKFWFWNSILGKPIFILGISPQILRMTLMLSFFASYLYLIYKQFRAQGQITKLCTVTAFMFLYLFSPVLHPWYLIWPLVFMPFNKFYNFFIFASALAYYPYGGNFLEGYAEVIQGIFLILAIRENLIDMNSIQLSKSNVIKAL